MFTLCNHLREHNNWHFNNSKRTVTFSFISVNKIENFTNKLFIIPILLQNKNPERDQYLIHHWYIYKFNPYSWPSQATTRRTPPLHLIPIQVGWRGISLLWNSEIRVIPRLPRYLACAMIPVWQGYLRSALTSITPILSLGWDPSKLQGVYDRHSKINRD